MALHCVVYIASASHKNAKGLIIIVNNLVPFISLCVIGRPVRTTHHMKTQKFSESGIALCGPKEQRSNPHNDNPDFVDDVLLLSYKCYKLHCLIIFLVKRKQIHLLVASILVQASFDIYTLMMPYNLHLLPIHRTCSVFLGSVGI